MNLEISCHRHPAYTALTSLVRCMNRPFVRERRYTKRLMVASPGSYCIAITQSFNKCTNVTHLVTFAAGSMLMAKLQQPFNRYGIS